MRRWMAGVWLTLSACGQVSGAPVPTPEPPPEAQHGGALVEVDGAMLEVVVHATGELHLHPVGRADFAEEALTLTLDDRDGTPHAVAMLWRDSVQGYVGQLESQPATGALRVLLTRDGRAARGEADLDELLPEPQHGGAVLALGSMRLEIVVEAEGSACLHLLGEPGEDVEREFVVNLPDEEGRPHPLELTWDAERGCHAGRLEGLRPAAGPLEVFSIEEGHSRWGRGTLPHVGAVPAELGDTFPEGLRLELPDLGSNLPSVIAVPPIE